MDNEAKSRGQRIRRTLHATFAPALAMGVATVLVVGGLTLDTTSAFGAATPKTSSGAPCTATVTAGTGQVVGSLIVGVTGGTTQITFDCNTSSAAAFAAQASLLSGIGTTSVILSSEADTSALATFTTSATDTGCPSATAGQCALATFAVPAQFSAADANAACPPTQSQFNAGLYGCVVAVATAAQVPLSGAEYLMTYASQTAAPNAPTIAATPVKGAPGSTVNISDASGSTGYWWGNAIQTNQAVALNTTPMAPPGTCTSGGYGTVPTPLLEVNWFAPASTTPIPGSAAGVTISNDCYDGKTLYAPVLGGTIGVPSTLTSGTTYTAYLCELNITPFPSNDANATADCGPAPAGASWIDASFAFSAAQGVISQNLPTANTVAAKGSAGFTDQLVFSGNSGAVTCTQSSGSADLTVSASGLVTTIHQLAGGTYTATGTTSDPKSNTGTFTYTLTVTPAAVPRMRVIRVIGYAWAGHTRVLTIVGVGFYGRPRIKSHPGLRAVLLRTTSTTLKVKVTVTRRLRAGVYTFLIIEPNGQRANVRFRLRA